MRFRKSLSSALLCVLIASGIPFCEQARANNYTESRNDSARLSAFARNPRADAESLTPIAMQAPTKMKKTINTPSAEDYLISGSLKQGEAAISEEISRNPNDDKLRFGLAIIQFIRSFEGLVQDLHRYGLKQLSLREIRSPIARIPIPKNAAPQTLTYAGSRKIIENFLVGLTKAEATLAAMHDESVKLPLRFGLIRFDLTGNGIVSEKEMLWRGYASLSSNADITEEKAKDFSITFDRGDVHWLRGYCNLLMAPCEMLLAYDYKESFERTGHLFFPKIDSPYGYLTRGKQIRSIGSDHVDITDIIAFIHLINWQISEPSRMAKALNHFEQVVALSRVSWKSIMAETDDDHEWLPNPRQTGVIPNVKVTEQMVSAWAEVMNEVERILKGEHLIPFWRGDDGRGVNLRKVFLEPRAFDLVLWVQGSAAAPYLQHGTKTKRETWRELQSQFGGNFPGFAVYFN